ncbi:MAG: citrate/2-methylcitrate synthase [Nitrosopumilus sp.]
MKTKNIGLRGIEIADTKISKIDGKKGILIYRGFNILDLAKNSTFEETAYLLLHDNLPTKSQLDEFSTKLSEARSVQNQIIQATTSAIQKNIQTWNNSASAFTDLNKNILQSWISTFTQPRN